MDRFTEAIGTAVGGSADRVELACAKINLALHVTGRRADGYRLIESLVVFAELADSLSILPSKGGRPGLTLRGPFARDLAEAGPARDNMAIRAAEALAGTAKKKPPPVKLELTKRIPVAAGLGGGSADAAAALRLLRRAWGLAIPDERLAEIGAPLGADVPMCVFSRPLVARGIGERITTTSGIPRLPVVLARPPVVVPTPAVFAQLGMDDRPPLPPLPDRFASPLDLVFWLRQSRNDLAGPASRVTKAAGAAARLLDRDPDCMFARMSGSGATAFGIFVSLAAAERAAERLSAAKPDWWIVATVTGGS